MSLLGATWHLRGTHKGRAGGGPDPRGGRGLVAASAANRLLPLPSPPPFHPNPPQVRKFAAEQYTASGLNLHPGVTPVSVTKQVGACVCMCVCRPWAWVGGLGCCLHPNTAPFTVSEQVGAGTGADGV